MRFDTLSFLVDFTFAMVDVLSIYFMI
jgi:hypothetical protein